ncbi:unnamed protein product [Linum tenue]|uniref:Pectinesterase inhibitor domain-containing protein n=1 Tax=Linum tenue TaxID=586396 RepID=A0AAV0S012_9ROSI|nr:unnamed protein product [Linum tenue]
MAIPTQQLATLVAVSFLLLLPHPSAAQPNRLIKETCKKTPDFDLCVSSLSAAPRAARATTVRELALAMIHVVEARATTTSLYIKRLAKTASFRGEEEAALKACEFYYGIIIDYDVPGAVTEVRYANPKFGVDSMVDSAREAELCEEEFRGGNKSPLTGRNMAVRRLANVAVAIIKSIH